MSESTVPGNDEQDVAELLDDDVVHGDDDVNVDHAGVTDPPAGWSGVPFADADVTDESFEERTAQEQPEVRPADIDERFADAESPVASLESTMRDE